MHHAEAELLPFRKCLILSQCPSLGTFLLAAKGVQKSGAIRGMDALLCTGLAPESSQALGGAGGYRLSSVLARPPLTSLLAGMADLQLPPFAPLR